MLELIVTILYQASFRLKPVSYLFQPVVELGVGKVGPKLKNGIFEQILQARNPCSGFYQSIFGQWPFFCQRFSFFTGCVVKFLHEVLPCWVPKGSVRLQIAGNSFVTLFLTADAQLAHFLSTAVAAAAIFPRAVEFHGGFYEIEFFNFVQV